MEEQSPSRPILFISRTYPPVLGGMETLSFNLIKTVGQLVPTKAIVNRYGKKLLPLFLPWALIKAFFLILMHDIRVVHLSDGVMAPLGVILKLFFRKTKVFCNLHGLDITYADKSSIYRKINLPAINRLDRLIAVSHDTKNTGIKFGLDRAKILVIPNGTATEENYRSPLKENFARKKAMEAKMLVKNNFFEDEKNFIILFLGRIVERKGLHWFIENVLTELPTNVKLIVAGSGPFEARVKTIIENNHLTERVLRLGFVSNKLKKFLLNASDLLVMPNIEVPGDKEGFGITAIEAGATELLPLVTGIEGLKDAVVQKRNGLILPQKDNKKWIDTINFLIENPNFRISLAKKARQFVKDHFDWSVIGKIYLKEFQK